MQRNDKSQEILTILVDFLEKIEQYERTRPDEAKPMRPALQLIKSHVKWLFAYLERDDDPPPIPVVERKRASE